jgi:hypothetical protein
VSLRDQILSSPGKAAQTPTKSQRLALLQPLRLDRLDLELDQENCEHKDKGQKKKTNVKPGDATPAARARLVQASVNAFKAVQVWGIDREYTAPLEWDPSNLDWTVSKSEGSLNHLDQV